MVKPTPGYAPTFAGLIGAIMVKAPPRCGCAGAGAGAGVGAGAGTGAGVVAGAGAGLAHPTAMIPITSMSDSSTNNILFFISHLRNNPDFS
jgi:hypothetical protein